MRCTGDVTGREHPRVAGALLIVDNDETPLVGLHPGGGQVQLSGSRRPTGGHEQPLTGQPPLLRGHHYDRGPVRFDRGGAVVDHGDAVVEEHPPQQRGQLGLGPRGEATDDGDLGSEVGEQLGLLKSDVPAADDNQRRRQAIQVHRRR